MPVRPTLIEIFLVALRLGCTSFGGPVAHLAFFREEYVRKRGWLDEAHYADLVALCQFLPGPASSQTGFAIGHLQRGLAGGLAAWLGFTLPSAVIMTGIALGFGALGETGSAGWLKGLKVAAVAVVAQAVWAMGRSLCPDWPRRALAVVAAGLVLGLPAAWSQVAVIAVGAIIGWGWLKPDLGGGTISPAGYEPRAPNPAGRMVPPPFFWLPYLILFFVLLFSLPWLAHVTAYPPVEITDRFYRAGSLVFGGGHVVLPLLEREVVPPGWVTPDQFLAGYGIAQAVPGPLFSFSAYLGAVMTHGPGGWAGGGLALAAVFLPGLLLVAGTLPCWSVLRHQPGMQAALRGANATVVGLLLAALWHPVGTAGISDLRTFAVAWGGFVALWSGKIPSWAVVAVSAGIGAVWF